MGLALSSGAVPHRPSITRSARARRHSAVRAAWWVELLLANRVTERGVYHSTRGFAGRDPRVGVS